MPHRVLSVTFTVPPLLKIPPPPSWELVLSDRVLWVTFSVPSYVLAMPPPASPTFPDRVLSLMVIRPPLLSMPPPVLAVLSETVEPVTFTVLSSQ